MTARDLVRVSGLAVFVLTSGCTEDEPDKPQHPPDEGPKQDICGEFPLETGTKVLFVLDKSGSMFTDQLAWDHDDDPQTPPIRRWVSLYHVVELIVDGFGDQLALGALLFPNTQGACHVNTDPEIPIAANNGQTLLDSLPGPNDEFDPMHLTPLAEAMENGLDYMLSFDPEDSKAMILVSDGIPHVNCDGGLAEATETARVAWEEHGIPTFVVGIAIEEQYSVEYGLLAAAGGRPDPDTGFFDTQDEIQLEAAMTEIASSIPDCNIKLDEEPTYPDMVDIVLGGQNLAKLDTCDGDGWSWVNEEYRLIELCGSACDALKAGENDVVASYGCPDESGTGG